MRIKRDLDLEYIRMQSEMGLATPEIKDKFQKDVIKRVLKDSGISINFIADVIGINSAKLSRCLNSSLDVRMNGQERAILKKAILEISKELADLSEIIEFQPMLSVEELKMAFGDSVNENIIEKYEKSFNEYPKKKFNIDFSNKINEYGK